MTLVELLVVVAIVGLMFSVSVPAVYGVRARFNKVKCQSQLRDIGIAFQMYLDTPRNGGLMPDAAQLPSVEKVARPKEKQRPAINVILARTDKNIQETFRCPDDQDYYPTENLSYEYRSGRFGGKRKKEITTSRGGRQILESTIIIMYDFGADTHEGWLAGRGRNLLYLDGHVDDGVDENAPPPSQPLEAVQQVEDPKVNATSTPSTTETTTDPNTNPAK